MSYASNYTKPGFHPAEAVERRAVKLGFFGGITPENINDIFTSRETIAVYRKSQADEVIVSLQAYTDANDKDASPLPRICSTRYCKCLLTT